MKCTPYLLSTRLAMTSEHHVMTQEHCCFFCSKKLKRYLFSSSFPPGRSFDAPASTRRFSSSRRSMESSRVRGANTSRGNKNKSGRGFPIRANHPTIVRVISWSMVSSQVVFCLEFASSDSLDSSHLRGPTFVKKLLFAS